MSVISDVLKKNIPLVVLNLLALSFYFLIISNTKYSFTDESFFYPPDSQQYLNTSSEFFDLSETGNSLTRPFFYPLIISLFYKTGGVFFLWFFQFICWIGTINLTFLSLRKKNIHPVISWVAILLIVINLSFIVFTMQALTEVVCIFMVSLLLYNWTHGDLRNIRNSHFTLAILVLLTVTRPVFFYIFLIYLIYHIVFHYIKSKQYFNNGVLLLLLLSPVVLQLSVMKIKYDKLKISDIDTITLDEYLLAQTIHSKNSTLEYSECIVEAKKIKDKKEFIIDNLDRVLFLFFRNIDESLSGYPSLFYTPKFEHLNYGKKMWTLNHLYYNLHIIFIIPLLIVLIWKIILKDEFILVLLFSFLICFYVVFTSGISFSQGDRLIITLLPLWIFLYSTTSNFILNRLKGK